LIISQSPPPAGRGTLHKELKNDKKVLEAKFILRGLCPEAVYSFSVKGLN